MNREKVLEHKRLRAKRQFLFAGITIVLLLLLTFLISYQWNQFKSPKAVQLHPVNHVMAMTTQSKNTTFVKNMTLDEEITNKNVPPAIEKENNNVVEPPEESPEISIVFAGDTMFDWALRPILDQQGYDYPFIYIKDKVHSADYSFINLETVFTEKSVKDPRQRFWIKSDIKGLQAVKNAGFKMLNIGNNHTLDYLHDGLLDTLSNIEKYEMDYIGAGRTAKEAYESKEIILKGKKFRFFTFVRFVPATDWLATEDEPGVPNGYDLNLVKKTILEQKGDADYTIVYFHWGVEKQKFPVEYQKEYVRELEKIGVDLIVGSHAHWLQGFEYYNDMAVAYSLGNFLFPPYVKDETAQTGLLTATFKGNDVRMAFDPHIIVNGQIRPLSIEDRNDTLHYLQSISFDVNISENGDILQN